MFENAANLGNDRNLYRLVAETKEGYGLFMESESLMTSSMRLLIPSRRSSPVKAGEAMLRVAGSRFQPGAPLATL